jgi:hypothetical protein
MSALLRRNCIVYRMRGHGPPNSLCYAKDAQPSGGIHWRRQHRQVHRYHAAGVERLSCSKSPIARLAGLQTASGVLLQHRLRTGVVGSCVSKQRHKHNTDAGNARLAHGVWPRIVTVAEEHSPGKPFLVSKWAGAQALTDRDGQP